MTALLIVALALAGQAPGDIAPRAPSPPPPPPRTETPLRLLPDLSGLTPLLEERAGTPAEGGVGEVLASNPDLLTADQGYRRYLAGHEDLARAEKAWWEALGIRRLRECVDAFDEALHDDANAQRVVDQYYDELRRDDALRAKVESVMHTELIDPVLGRHVSAAFDYLRANPDAAMRALEAPERLDLLPEELSEAARRLSERPELMASLRDSLGDLMEDPAALQRVFPGWQALAGLDDGGGAAQREMSAYFHRHPQHFWLWHRRNLLLAEDAQARSWIRWWHRTIRRAPALHEGYAAYLSETPEPAEAAEPWPPKTAPPRLAAWASPSPDEGAPASPTRPPRPTYERPSRGNLELPEMPSRPDRPAGPRRPDMPDMPPMPPRPERPPRPARP